MKRYYSAALWRPDLSCSDALLAAPRFHERLTLGRVVQADEH
jgi:hypothetical protein